MTFQINSTCFNTYEIFIGILLAQYFMLSDGSKKVIKKRTNFGRLRYPKDGCSMKFSITVLLFLTGLFEEIPRYASNRNFVPPGILEETTFSMAKIFESKECESSAIKEGSLWIIVAVVMEVLYFASSLSMKERCFLRW